MDYLSIFDSNYLRYSDEIDWDLTEKLLGEKNRKAANPALLNNSVDYLEVILPPNLSPTRKFVVTFSTKVSTMSGQQAKLLAMPWNPTQKIE